MRGYVPNNRSEVAYEITINGRDSGHCKRKNRVENPSVMKKDYGCDKKIQFKEESNPKQEVYVKIVATARRNLYPSTLLIK